MKKPNTSRVPPVNPPSTPMMKITTTRVTSTVVLTGQLVHVDGELLVDEPAE